MKRYMAHFCFKKSMELAHYMAATFRHAMSKDAIIKPAHQQQQHKTKQTRLYL